MCEVEEECNECSLRENENGSVALSQTVKQEMGTDHEYSIKNAAIQEIIVNCQERLEGAWNDSKKK